MSPRSFFQRSLQITDLLFVAPSATPVISLLLPSSSSPAVRKQVKAVKDKSAAAAATVSEAAADATEKVKEQVAPVAEAGKQKAEELQEGVRTRAKAAKNKADE